MASRFTTTLAKDWTDDMATLTLTLKAMPSVKSFTSAVVKMCCHFCTVEENCLMVTYSQTHRH